MKTTIHKSESRGQGNHGWLVAKHTFSFADYFDRQRMNFGVLRVLNDDMIAGGNGFGSHPHDNMEIITIPLEGSLRHKDSMGNTSVIRKGEVQVMSAGTGIVHSEFNDDKEIAVKLLQIWVLPNEQNVTPRYQQQAFDLTKYKNTLTQIVSPKPKDANVWIHQQAWFNLGLFDKGNKLQHTLNKPDNGIYAFIIAGAFNISGTKLETRDGMGIWETDMIELESLSDESEILLMEVPMLKG